MPTCPNGHQSVAEDWCEVCGHRMLAPAAVPPPPAPPGYPGSQGQGPPQPPPYPGAGAPGAPSGHPGYPGQGAPATAPMARTELCPQCHTPREAQAPFCEECRYNFLTNSPTTYIPPTPPGPRQPVYGQQPQASAPPRQQQHHPQHTEHSLHTQAPPQPSGDWMLPPPSHQPPPQYQAPPRHQAPPGYPSAPQPQQTAGWLVTIGPDPAYFAAMMRRSGPEAAQLTLPAYAPEQRLPLTGPQVTIGRRRQSTGEAPDIDLAQAPEDPGVSHQHAVLVQQPDGGWAVVDQDSTNGTTVNGAEDPIQPFVPVPLHEGDRVHIGAWTTLTLYRG
ncbi:FHA domain-containing protein [Streptomyces sp. NBC_01803]|uniref:FHA domain-containing protein n=1 Tax=Streptomyces sp. NBC_01803 TaxID=2975946 RepID=UPI002DD94F58|nr:FHA domain-containing protein [Streptomyces sp. NBC_01803]WSA46180.1 FHA domain-containing protein [Streptomyces sp. NBC_01803]